MTQFRTRSGRPTFYPDSPLMTDCCHSTAEWCARESWPEAFEHARERARRSKFRQKVYRSFAHERVHGGQFWIISIYGPGGNGGRHDRRPGAATP